MVTVNGAYQNQLNTVSTQIGTDVTVRPAGFFGNAGGGEPLDETKVDEIAKLPHVVSIAKTVEARYSGTSLVSAIQPGTLGNQGTQFPSNNSGQSRQFRMTIEVMGFDVTDKSPTLTGGGTVAIVQGRYFNSDEASANVAIVGKDLAVANNLSVGSKVDLNGTEVQVVGIFDTGQLFGNNTIVLPVKTAETIFSIKGLTDVTVTVDDANNEDLVVSEIRKIFNENTADITTSASMYERISTPINNAMNSSKLAMIISFSASAVIIVFSVLLMIRQKIKEVGIMKAIGASNIWIGMQFALETFSISVIASFLGALITFPLAQKISSLLVSSGRALTANRGGLFGSGGGFTRIGNITVAVSPTVFVYAFLIAICLALLASLVPMIYISQVKPAEVLRYE
jgi:putative ABC transport system permease protein